LRVEEPILHAPGMLAVAPTLNRCCHEVVCQLHVAPVIPCWLLSSGCGTSPEC
jgi:hypothetical protein